MPSQTLCSDQSLIDTVHECKQAAKLLGIPYDTSGEWRSGTDFKGCLVARDGRNQVYFNTANDLTTSAESMFPKYRSICRRNLNGGNTVLLSVMTLLRIRFC